jgi:very-short-patch-repair endonuclease
LRRNPTDAEVKVWDELKLINGLLPEGTVWFRQVCVGRYIIDFACPKAKLALEVDGSSHYDKQRYDATREHFLRRVGYEVTHINNLDANDAKLVEGLVKGLLAKTLHKIG